MKVIQVPFCYYPDQVGGTEIYVESLARHLQLSGVETIIAAPGQNSRNYEHGGLKVRRFAVTHDLRDLRDIYGEGDAAAAEQFGRILDEEKPDAIHMHAFTSGVSLRLVRQAKRRGIKVLFTYHTPSVSCQRGTLLRWGNEVCDGELQSRVCAACTLHARGMNKIGSRTLAHVPDKVDKFIASTGLSGKPWTALRMSGLMRARHSAFRSLLDEVDRTVTLSDWSRDLLLRNGVDQNKLTLSRHGLCESYESMRLIEDALAATPTLRIAFLSRIDPIKGADVLIRALRALPETKVKLDIYNADSTGPPTDHLADLQRLAANDSRIAFHPAVEHECVIELLRGYHLLAVPSRCFETGPLVVLEAFAACVPVIGSDLGGIAELVEDEVNGLLVEVDSVKAWQAAIVRLCDDPALVERLRRGIQPPRLMRIVAQEMLGLYRELIPAKASLAAIAGR